MGNPNVPPFYVVVTNQPLRGRPGGRGPSSLGSPVPEPLRKSIEELVRVQPSTSPEGIRSLLVAGETKMVIGVGMGALLELIKAVRRQLGLN
ncbi:hypothetical protein [Nonomuraea sp. NPDC049480]|uniref:hypothetical protein n=1 Tax=Nonomuraea sp. NPDC049480 TaxID=3364353 RepID=UPI0037943A97